jgi:hypothetical protein
MLGSIAYILAVNISLFPETVKLIAEFNLISLAYFSGIEKVIFNSSALTKLVTTVVGVR